MTVNCKNKLMALLLSLAAGTLMPVFADVTVSEAQIRQAVSKHVQQALTNHIAGQADVQASVDILNIPSMPVVLTSAKKVDIDVASNLSKTYSERLVTRVTLTDDLGNVRIIGVPVKIAIQKLVWVATDPVNAKSGLSTNNFTLQSKDVSRQFSVMVGREYVLSDYIARVNIQPGEILDARKIVKPPDIVRNSEVNILLSNNQGMVLSVTGIALSDGRVGETIKVRQNIYSTRYYNAKVIDKNRVQVSI